MPDHLLLSVLLAALVGGLIGLEREYHDKTAGLRTMILVATGSALFTILSQVIGGAIDPARIAAALVSGIGFLGAGAIIKAGMNIRGLTTAATIWLVASLGMGMGAGQYALTFAVTFFVLLVLWILPFLERRIDAMHQFLPFYITTHNHDDCEQQILDILKQEKIHYVSLHRNKEYDHKRKISIMAKNTPAKHDALAKRLANADVVLKFEN
jgi:putative Mg2+ transporter-C (MgtC) family protein